MGVGGGEEGLAATEVEPLPTYLFSLLLLVLLVSCLRLRCQIQTNKDSPPYFLLSFKTLALIFRPLIHFELIFLCIFFFFIYLTELGLSLNVKTH